MGNSGSHPTAISADTRRPDIVRFEQECVLFFEEAMQVFGMPKSIGQIYGLLYASPEPLSFSDIVERLGISKGSASQGMQMLRSIGAIGVADSRGGIPAASSAGNGNESSRREYYQPALSLRQLMSGILRERVTPLAVTSTQRVKRLRELASEFGDGGGFYMDRVKRLELWRQRIRRVLPLLSALLGPKRP